MRSKTTVWLGGKPVALPSNENREILSHPSRAIVTHHLEDDTVTIRVPRTIARVMFHCASERAFGESGYCRAIREYQKSEVLSRHAIGLAERARQLKEKGDSDEATVQG